MQGLMITQLLNSNVYRHYFAIIKVNEINQSKYGGWSKVKHLQDGAMWNSTVMIAKSTFKLEFE